MYARILTPTDGSPVATRGVQEAIALAKALKAKLVVLHAIDDFPITNGRIEGGRNILAAAARLWLEDTRAPKERQTAAAAQSKSGHHQVSPAHVMDAAWLRTIQAVYPSLNQIKDAAETHAEHRHPCSHHHIPQAVAPAFGRPC